MLTYDKYRHRFESVISALGLNPGHRPHDPRTTFVTNAKKAKVDKYALKRMVGHKIQDIIEAVYTKRDLEWLQNDIEKIGTYFTTPFIFEEIMDIVQECAANFKQLTETTTYIFHTSLKKNIIVFSIDFLPIDFHHAIGLKYLHDISIPKNTKKTIDWILDTKNPITDHYLAADSEYNGKQNQERDVALRISEFRFLEEYLDEKNIVYIYSPKDSPYKNSIIPCDYIIESTLKTRKQTVFIFLKHRSGANSPCRIMSFGVKKNVQYGGIHQYVILKDKINNGVRINIFKHPRYTSKQILSNKPTAKATYIDELIQSENVNIL